MFVASYDHERAKVFTCPLEVPAASMRGGTKDVSVHGASQTLLGPQYGIWQLLSCFCIICRLFNLF